VPRDLWDVETGAAYRRRLGARREWGTSAGIGSASDHPFHSGRELSLRATASCRLPSRERDSWILFLSFSNNRSFANNIPLPGAAYQLSVPDRGLDLLLGLPFLAANYRPSPDWAGRAALFGPDNLSAEWAWLGRRPWQVYAGFDWSQREWLRADRAARSDRLFYDSKKWSLGTRLAGRRLRLDVSAGYESGRRFYEGLRAHSAGVPAAELKAAWGLGLKAGFDW
jgi:hypothetical protein